MQEILPHNGCEGLPHIQGAGDGKVREHRDGIGTNQCPRVDNDRATLRARVKSLIDFADYEVVVVYRGFGLGWSWHGGVEVTRWIQDS